MGLDTSSTLRKREGSSDRILSRRPQLPPRQYDRMQARGPQSRERSSASRLPVCKSALTFCSMLKIVSAILALGR